MGIMVESYPTILGCDVAGVIHAVGREVTSFKKGDRVCGQAFSLTLGPKYGFFQTYVPRPEDAICLVPKDISFASACVVPLSINTAADTLFTSDGLNLPRPQVDAQPCGRTILVYGGSTSVGGSDIQLAKAAGAKVVAIAGTNNHEYCRTPGPDYTIDYKDADWVDQAISISQSSRIDGIFNTISREYSTGPITRLGGKILLTRVDLIPGYEVTKAVFGANIIFDSDLTKAIWAHYLPQALEQGKFVPVPEPKIVGKGLAGIQKGFDVQRAGVSAQKVVVEID